jgi:hypothetical protein
MFARGGFAQTEKLVGTKTYFETKNQNQYSKPFL